MILKSSFWLNKRVLITGHTGFKGGWLSLWLQSLGAEVTGIALNPSSNPNLFDVASVSRGMKSIIGDIRDLNFLIHSFKDFQPEIVFHLAAQSLVRSSYEFPVETYATNIMGTVHLLEAIRQTSSVKSVVCVTSDKCYENKEWMWGYRENDSIGGHDPYSNSKGCSELVVSGYRYSFFNSKKNGHYTVGVATGRAGNVIGGGDWSTDRLLPDIISAYQKSTPVLIRNPNSIRPWQHVLEPLGGYLKLAEALYFKREDYSEAWNFGPNDDGAKSVEWILQKISILLEKKDFSWEIDKGNHPHEANYLKLDISKAIDKLNWRPKLELTDALRMTLDWVNAQENGADMRNFCLNQINYYEELGN
jgi:CDP-glucose 4,6-dehydratase